MPYSGKKSGEEMIALNLLCADYDVIQCETEEQWLMERSKGVGASEVAILLGLSQWASPFSLCAQKRGEIPPGESDSEILEWGRYMEDPIARRYADRTGRKLKDLGRFTIMRSKRWPWLFATLDRVIVEVPTEGIGADLYPVAPTMTGPAPLEIKAATIYGYHNWDDGAPLHYQAQLQTQLAVTGWKWGSINPGMPTGKFYPPIDCERNEEFIELVVSTSRAFMDCVENGTWPPVDGSEATATALKTLFPKDSGATVDVPHEAAPWFAELTLAREQKKLADAHADECKNKIAALMQDATFAQLPTGEKWSFKAQTKKEHVVRESTSRVLRKVGGK